MRNLMIATMLAGLPSVFVGCSEGEAPASDVADRVKILQPKSEGVSLTSSADADAPPKVDLVEPELESEASGELIVGDAAPPISIAKWVRGEPVGALSRDKVYVVEFWATWCRPCIAGMPHIASLQTEYGDKVTFIGVTDEEEDVVSEFMDETSRSGKKWSEVLTYRIALDQNRRTNAAYMRAAGQNGIPCAFIVGKTGKVEWIGHPAAIDSTLEQVVAGTWDSAAARKAFLVEREVKLVEHQAQMAIQRVGGKIQTAIENDDFKTAVTLIDELIVQFPAYAEFKMARFQFLLKGEMFEEANAAAKVLVDAANDNALELHQLAWILSVGVTSPGPDLDLALSAANRAVELTKSENASVLDTLGHVLFAKGNIEEAIEIEKKAIEIASPDEKEQYEAALKEFEAAGAVPEKKEAEPATPEAKPAAPAAPVEEPEAPKAEPAAPEAEPSETPEEDK